LGLFLTKAILEAHGGRIWFSRNGQNDGRDEPGTTFTFSLPRPLSENEAVNQES
jgi:signal transduction histidine kinase